MITWILNIKGVLIFKLANYQNSNEQSIIPNASILTVIPKY